MTKLAARNLPFKVNMSAIASLSASDSSGRPKTVPRHTLPAGKSNPEITAVPKSGKLSKLMLG